MKLKTNEKGFSLVELLVVVIIIAIIAAIAIPSLLASRRAANEASAISALRTIHSAEATYFGTTGLNADYATLAELDTDDLIDTVLANATTAATGKSGFWYTLTEATGLYCVIAQPNSSGTTGTGNRWFGGSNLGVINGATTNTITCPANVLTGGTPIQ